MSEILKAGDYVLATKYDDGDPCDHFCIGWLREINGDRFIIIDDNGNPYRANGFRRAESITEAEGMVLVQMASKIGDIVGPSLWWHLAKMRGEENPNDPCEREEVRIKRELETLRSELAEWKKAVATAIASSSTPGVYGDNWRKLVAMNEHEKEKGKS